jgi:putative flippase GtrA
MEKLLNYLNEHRYILLYLIFGVFTTVVNYIVYISVSYVFRFQTTAIPNIIAWVVAVLFAYFTNRKWVFESKLSGFRVCILEFLKFSASRLTSLAVETAILFVFVDYLGFSNLVTKILANIFVVIMNYVLGRFWVFSKGK